MIDFNINKIDLISYFQFHRLAKKLLLLYDERHVNIYIEETGTGDLLSGLMFYDKIKSMTRLGFEINVYLNHATEQGTLVLLAVPFENRFMGDLGQIKWNIFHQPDEKQEKMVNLWDGAPQFFTAPFYQYTQAADIITRETALDYTAIEKFDHQPIDSQTAMEMKLVSDTYQIMNNREEAFIYTNYVMQEKKLLYLFPEPYQEKMQEWLTYYEEGVATRKELAHIVLDQALSFIEKYR